jgi:MFS family permease
LAVSYFMTVIDLTIVNVSLPTIGRDLQFSETSLQWVVTAYALTFGGFLLLGGRAADLLGRRRVLMFGLGLFTAASLACGLATGEGFLIGSRAVQGVGAAITLTAALSIVMIMFEEGAERNKALGIWGGIAAGGPTVGLITGGLLTRSARDPTAHRRPTLASSWSSATASPSTAPRGRRPHPAGLRFATFYCGRLPML